MAPTTIRDHSPSLVSSYQAWARDFRQQAVESNIPRLADILSAESLIEQAVPDRDARRVRVHHERRHLQRVQQDRIGGLRADAVDPEQFLEKMIALSSARNWSTSRRMTILSSANRSQMSVWRRSSLVSRETIM